MNQNTPEVNCMHKWKNEKQEKKLAGTIPLTELVLEIEKTELSEKDLESVTGGTDAPPPPPPTTITGG
jgi:bacteriocin-like protein